jgi:hypothetical protein
VAVKSPGGDLRGPDVGAMQRIQAEKLPYPSPVSLIGTTVVSYQAETGIDIFLGPAIWLRPEKQVV